MPGAPGTATVSGPPGDRVFVLGSRVGAAGNGRECTLGEMILTAGDVANGVPASGQILSISQNQALFALPNLAAAAPIGHTYSICTVGIFPSR